MILKKENAMQFYPFCIRKNAKMIMVPKSNFKLLKGKEDLSLSYHGGFNLNLAEHFFSSIAGI